MRIYLLTKDMMLKSQISSTTTLDCVKSLGGLLGNHQATTVYDSSGVSPTLVAGMDHGNTMPYIVEVEHE